MNGEELFGIDWMLNEDSTGLVMNHEHSLAIVLMIEAVVEPEPSLVDGDSIEIEEVDEEYGRTELCNEENVYALLGLRCDNKSAEGMARETTSNSRPHDTSASGVPNVEGTEGAAIPVSDHTPEETVMVYDQKPGNVSVMVTVLNDVHTCTSSSRRRTTTPSAKWVASKAVSILRKKPQMGTKELQIQLQDEHKCKIGYHTVRKGQEKALKLLYGTWEESFQLLYNWKAEVMKRSPDSIIEIDTKVVEDKVYFHRFFCALGPCIEGFRSGCRPWLGIDATALTGRWCRKLASAIGVDGHNWMYPAAFGFIDGETEDNWKWFLTQLYKLVGDLPLLAICTDACPGLCTAVRKVFPQAEQRECFRHLMENFKKAHSGESIGHMWPAARAYDKDIYEKHMAAVYAGTPRAKSWLHKNHKLKWKRSDFNPDIKCDYVTNNIAESFNNWIREISDLPVVELANKIREMTMVLFHKWRKIGERLYGRILPAVLQILNARTRGLGYLTVIQGNNYAAEVWDNCNYRFVVKAYCHECTCFEWQHTGKPCQHALSLITAQQIRNVRMEDFIHDYYSVEKFRKAYARMVEPLSSKEKWPKVDLPFEVAAPLTKRGVGRQRKSRYKSCLEGGSGGPKTAENENEKIKKRVRGKMTCPRCGLLGHRQASYKCPMDGTKKRKREPRKKYYYRLDP